MIKITSSTGSTPSGAAGGDLGGTYPDPTVTLARGLKSATTTVSVSAATAPSSGQVLQATAGTTATWQTPPFSTNARTVNAQSGTTYTLAASDASTAGTNPLVTFGSGSATTVTVPLNASVAISVGSQVECIQIGAGKVTFAAEGGVTLNSQATNKAIAAQYVGVSLVKTATNTWYLLGNLIA